MKNFWSIKNMSLELLARIERASKHYKGLVLPLNYRSILWRACSSYVSFDRRLVDSVSQRPHSHFFNPVHDMKGGWWDYRIGATYESRTRDYCMASSHFATKLMLHMAPISVLYRMYYTNPSSNWLIIKNCCNSILLCMAGDTGLEPVTDAG